MDDDERINLSREQVQEILQWATGAGALLKVLDFRPDNLPDEEEIVILRHTVETMTENMPEWFADHMLDAGVALYEKYVEEERLVEEFKREMDEFL